MLNSKSNNRIQSAHLESQRFESALSQSRTAYFPTISANAILTKKDSSTAFEPKTIQGLEIGTRVNLFDGLRRESILSGIHTSINSANFNAQQEQQNVSLEATSAYYNYFSTQARLDAITNKKTQLKSDVERFSILVKNGLATNDILKTLTAASLAADYEEEAEKITLIRNKKQLELLSGEVIDDLSYIELSTPAPINIDRADLHSQAEQIKTLRHTEGLYTYLPTISLAAKHKEFNYGDYDTMGGSNIQPRAQNEVSATFSMVVFDMGSISKEREQAHLTTLRAQKMHEYNTKQIQNEAEIAILVLNAAKNSSLAAKSELDARTEAFSFIKTRFENGLVNSNIYLNELSSLSLSQAKVKIANNSEQIAKANLAYTYGIDLSTLIKESK